VYALAALFFIIGNSYRTGIPNIDFFILFPLGFLLMASNSYLNLYILSKHFPDKLLSSSLKNFSTGLFVINILFTLLLVLLIIIGIAEEFNKQNRDEYVGKIVLAVLLFVLASWIYILLMQKKMHGDIKRQHDQLMSSMINSIGE
jgi:hypothetical protein